MKALSCTLWICAAALCLALYAANLYLGDVNQDEGWYLYTSRLVSEGERPYVDFATTQGPVMAYGYALAQPLVARWGVAGGRLFTMALGLAACAGAAVLAARMAGPDRRGAAALTALALVGVNVYQSYFFTIVKTYALCGLLLVLGAICLSFMRSRRGRLWVFVAGVLFTLAGGTRSSAAMLLPSAAAVLAWRAWRDRGTADRVGPGHVAALIAGSAAAGLVVYAPLLLRAPQGVWFALVEYHAGREAGGILRQLLYKAGFLSRMVRGYYVAVALLVGLVLRRAMGGAGEGERVSAAGAGSPMLAILGLGTALVTLVHLLAPFPYDDYQAVVYPLGAAALAVWFTGTLRARRPGTWTVTAVVLLCAASAFSSPRVQDWFVGRQDRMWWPLKQETPLAQLQRVGRRLRAMAGPQDRLLTQDTYLAVESGLSVPRGLEMGPFSYFPEWSRERAEARHVLNREMMHELLETTDAPVAALSEWSLAVAAPAIAELNDSERDALWAIVNRRYRPVENIENFGHAATTLRILTLKDRANE